MSADIHAIPMVSDAFKAVGVTTGARMRLAITDTAKNRATSRRRTIAYPATPNKGLEVAPLHKPLTFAGALTYGENALNLPDTAFEAFTSLQLTKATASFAPSQFFSTIRPTTLLAHSSSIHCNRIVAASPCIDQSQAKTGLRRTHHARQRSYRFSSTDPAPNVAR